MIWPIGETEESLNELDLFIVELDLTKINPYEREAEFLFDLSLGRREPDGSYGITGPNSASRWPALTSRSLTQAAN